MMRILHGLCKLNQLQQLTLSFVLGLFFILPQIPAIALYIKSPLAPARLAAILGACFLLLYGVFALLYIFELNPLL